MISNVTKRIKGRITGFLGCLGLFMTLTVTAQAQSLVLNAPHYEDIPGCNQDVYNAIKYVGQANALREIQLAEETLFKPESVFHLTCFGDQITNAARTINSQDRFLWRQGGVSGQRHAQRANQKVRNWMNNTWLPNNYATQLITGAGVGANCAAIQNLWSFITGNGIKRSLTNANGNPTPGAGYTQRPDATFFMSTDELWTSAWTQDYSVQDQLANVITNQADVHISTMENDQFNATNDIQTQLINVANAPYSGSEGGVGCTGNACLTGCNILRLYANLTGSPPPGC